jgi:uncharacterized protein (AIM24 family)
MDAWFVVEAGQQTGPLSEAQLMERVRAGAVDAQALCWKEGMTAWQPLGQVRPDLVRPASPPPPPAPAGRTVFEVLRRDVYQMARLSLQEAEVVVEGGAMHYMRGEIAIEAQLPSVGGWLKAKVTHEKAVRPVYRGSGEIFLEPTFGECVVMELNGEEWILDQGAFLACDRGVGVELHANKLMTGLFGGEGYFQTKVFGRGKVMIHAQGPVEEIRLQNDTLKVDGSFAVARTGSLEFRLEQAAGKLFSSWVSGEGMVQTYRGTGTVLIAPVPHRFLAVAREFGGVHSAISRISKG